MTPWFQIELLPHEVEELRSIYQSGLVPDGGVISKATRDHLVEKKLVYRSSGMNGLTLQGQQWGDCVFRGLFK
jgi:hypothetical protein